MAEVQTVIELAENLSTYREQLQQVKELLVSEPANEEYLEMARGLEEVIELTEDLLNSAQQTEPLPAPQSDPAPAVALPGLSSAGLQPVAFVAAAAPPVPHPHESSGAGRIPVGTKVQAIWNGDGGWYEATVEAVTAKGYRVTFNEYGNKEEVELDQIRLSASPEPPEGTAPEDAEADADPAGAGAGAEGDSLAAAEAEAEAARRAIQRKLAEAADQEVTLKDVPAKLRIRPDDPDDVKAAKKKKIHSFKSKQRLEVMELTQNKRQNAWQQFQTKGKAKKVGFFTGRRKESIFKSPQDVKGKVGVTGSGQGMTDFQKREKYVPGSVADDSED